MSSSMSTPISQLPANATASNTSSEDDPFITGVIQEMEKEVNKQPTSVQPQPLPQMYIPMPITTPVTTAAPQTQASWYNETFAKRAAIVAVIAFLMFYPNDLTPIYEKAPILSRFAAYDRLIRMLLLAVVLYVLFWKLNI